MHSNRVSLLSTTETVISNNERFQVDITATEVTLSTLAYLITGGPDLGIEYDWDYMKKHQTSYVEYK